MQIEALKVFCDVARLRSFSKGAEANGLSQSMASQTIHQLEVRLGVTLIDRSVRPWALTGKGKAFYEGCSDLLDRYDKLESEVAGRMSPSPFVIRLVSIYSVGLQQLSDYIAAFSRLHPEATVEIDVEHPDQVLARILNDEADIGILSFPPSRRELTVIPWRREELAVACPPTHRFASLKEVPVKELSGERFVALDRGLGLRREIDRYLRRNGVEVEVALDFDNIEEVKSAVEGGAGISILPRPTLEREVRFGSLAAIPLVPNAPSRPLGIIQRRGRRTPPALRRLIELLQNGKEVLAA